MPPPGHIRVLNTSVGIAFAIATAGACAGGPSERVERGVTPPRAEESHAKLSDWGLFKSIDDLDPGAGVVEYDVISATHADYANARRFFYQPDGARIGYEPTAPWTLANGSILAQSFAYESGARLETRILYLNEGSWRPFVYVWRKDNSDADLELAGETLNVSWVDPSGDVRETDYHVPNVAQCVVCHAEGREQSERTALRPLSFRTRQLNRPFG